MQNQKFQKNKQKAKQVLILYSKLLRLQQSCWGKTFLFQKTQFFQKFNKKYRIKGIISLIQNQVIIIIYTYNTDIFQIRLDELIYLALLAAIMILFFAISSDPSNILVKAYRIFSVQLFLSSSICVFIKSTIKYLCLFFICIIYPLMMHLIFQNFITLDDTAKTQIFQYIGYLSLFLVYILTVLVYPLKSFISQKLGSLYGYLYGLSVLTLLCLWPLYSIVQQFSVNYSITLLIIFNNRPLVITFMIIIIFSIYIFIHNIFFQGDKVKLYKILKSIFNSQQIGVALNQIKTQDINQYEYFNIQTRIMSLIVLSTTIGLQLFLFLKMDNTTQSMMKSLSLMIYAIFFLIFGTLYYIIPIKNRYAIPFFTLISVTPLAFSFLYSQKFTYWQYLCSMFSISYIVLFWSVIRVIQQFRPLFQNKILAILYTLIHIPAMIFVMDTFDYFNSGNTIGPVGYICLIIIIVTLLSAVIISIVKLCIQLSQIQKQTTKNTTQLDFNYQQTLNYKPYKKLNSFTLQWLSKINLIDVGTFLNSFFFLVSMTITFYNLNDLIYTYTESYFFSGVIYELTYSVLAILPLFMIYSHYYIYSKNTNLDNWIVGFWIILGLFGIIYSYISTIIPFSFRVLGGFSLAMILITLGFKFLKDQSAQILPFLAPVLIIFLWITIIIPYSIMIPSVSIYIDQSQFGIFIYNCILGTVLLLIVLVGIVSMIFNNLMNKFQQERRYKYVIQDVKQFFDEEGVQTNDQVLHVFHEAYQSRNKKYIFYLKNGYPLNITKDEDTHTYKVQTYDRITKNTLNGTFMKTKKSTSVQQQKVDNCWKCLTFLCGEDQQQIEQKFKKALEKNLINQQQAENLLPHQTYSKRLLPITKKNQIKKQKQTRIRPNNVNSTKTLLLNTFTQAPRRLGPEYTLLKLQKSRKSVLQIYDTIFNLFSNSDKGQNLVIFNDFKKFCELSELNLIDTQFEELFNTHAKTIWGPTISLNYQQFACAIQDISQKVYKQKSKNQQERIINLLIDKIYYNLAGYEQFNEARRTYNPKEFNINLSGFNGSLNKFKIVQQQRQKQIQKLVQYYKKQKNNIDQKRQNQILQTIVKKQIIKNQQDQVVKQKGKSCKKYIYQKYQAATNCCKLSVLKEENLKKKQKIKPWSYLSCQAAKILHRKTALWEDQHEIKQYQFRLIINNILMAIFKLIDLWAYLQVTLRDPQVQWYDGAQFSFLFIEYKYQLYACLALAFITVPLGLKGITFIFQDRLGLTEARIPAGFPHPMFFYTVIYKILVLSLFSILSSTFLVTFSCTWTQKASPYTLYSDNTIQCLSAQHNIYMILSLFFLIVYFPLSSYTFPNFQFSEKRLDLKFRPSYLVLYFQVNFILATNKVLLSLASSNKTVQIAYISINIVSLTFLSFICLKMKPCLIQWFNWIQFLTIFIGVIWNVGGLVLYLTRQWTYCVIVAGAITLITIILVIIIIKSIYFSTNLNVNAIKDNQQFNELRMGLDYKKKKNKIISQQHGKNLQIKQNNDLDKQKSIMVVPIILQDTDGINSQQQIKSFKEKDRI